MNAFGERRKILLTDDTRQGHVHIKKKNGGIRRNLIHNSIKNTTYIEMILRKYET